MRTYRHNTLRPRKGTRHQDIIAARNSTKWGIIVMMMMVSKLNTAIPKVINGTVVPRRSIAMHSDTRLWTRCHNLRLVFLNKLQSKGRALG